MKLIPVGKQHFAKVDDEDYDRLIIMKWHLKTRKGLKYANNKSISMHTIITGFKMTDHKDREGLNNQKENLRECSYSDNMRNREGYGKSKYKGVYPYKNGFIVEFRMIDKSRKYLGFFKTEDEAGRAYNDFAKINGNSFTVLNDSLISCVRN